jgi:hypothetical protein
VGVVQSIGTAVHAGASAPKLDPEKSEMLLLAVLLQFWCDFCYLQALALWLSV